MRSVPGIERRTTTTVQEPVHARGPQRAGRAGSGLVDSPAFLLRELESSSEGCQRLIDEWTRLREWSERLGSGRLPTQDISSKLENLQRAVRLLGLRIADTGAAAVTTAEPLAASFPPGLAGRREAGARRAGGRGDGRVAGAGRRG
jgi:hypothetical protein